MTLIGVATRGAIVAAGLVLIAQSVPASYTARLYFRNDSTGEDGIGAIPVIPGQVVSANWSFHADPTDKKKPHWTILQVVIDLTQPSGDIVLTDADSNTWKTQVAACFSYGGSYPYVQVCGPQDGPLYDWFEDPTNSTFPLVCTKGVCMTVGCSGSSAVSKNVDARFFRFSVGPADPGSELHWSLAGHDTTNNGIGTVFYDWLNKWHDPTNNFLSVAATSTISGRVIFSDVLGGSTPASIPAVLTRSGQPGHTITLNLAPDGSYILPLAADNYTLSVKGTHWLRKRISIVAAPGDALGQDLEMVNGDAYDDGSVSGKIDLFDLSLVLSNMGETEPDPYSDLDEDGAVTLTDLVIVLSGMGTVGDPA